jgi:polygalacturonase
LIGKMNLTRDETDFTDISLVHFSVLSASSVVHSPNMKTINRSRFIEMFACAGVALILNSAAQADDPRATDQAPQVRRAMHIAMKDRPRITVASANADIVGSDNRAIQSGIDYIAGLGGGVVEIGDGEFLMRDSLHLRSNVSVRGQGERTILRKARSSESSLAADGDYGEEQITLKNPEGFAVGDGVTIRDDNAGGFHTTVARITGRNDNVFSISLPLNADCLVARGAKVATTFPVISGYHVEGARVENVTVDGNKAENAHLNGCRGAGIFLYRCPGAVIERCVVRAYNGDGISFQQCNDVTVRHCLSEDNASLGIHPGSGSQRPVVTDCVARGNGEDGLFLCWRVKHGLFENNRLEANGRFGISIGHKDTDNIIRRNNVVANHKDGICFRNEPAYQAGHRNRIEENIIENNGGSGIRVEGETTDLVFRKNVIRDTRNGPARKQAAGIRLDERVGDVAVDENEIDAATSVDDRRNKEKKPE